MEGSHGHTEVECSSLGTVAVEDDLEEGRGIRRGSEVVLEGLPEEGLASKSSAHISQLALSSSLLSTIGELCFLSEGRQRKYRHEFAHSDQVCD